MLKRRRPSGSTLVELLVSLTLAAIVLGTATSSVLRQRRTANALTRTAGGDAQMRAALGAMTVELSALTAGAGDVVPGQATDTAIELRGFVASGLSCADAVSSAIYGGAEDGSVGGAVPRSGDTLWWFGGDPPRWRGRGIVASDSVWAACPLASTGPGPARRLAIAGTDSIPYGAPLRVTRPIRYAFYRSGDGSWQLGMREWSDASLRFAAPQPIAGAFVMRAGSTRTGFRFFDADGRELGTDGAGVPSARVSRVRISVISADRLGAGSADTVLQRDSVDVALQALGAP